MSDQDLPFLHRLAEPPRSVVLFRASRLGDLLCAVPAFRSLRAALPTASFTLISLPWGNELVQRLPYLDRFELFPGYPGMAEQTFEPRRTLEFLERMQAERFDLAVQIHGSGVFSNPFVKLLGARWSVGFRRPEDHFMAMDASLPMPEEGTEVERLLALPRFLGAPDMGTDLEFPLMQQDEDELDRSLALAGAPRQAGLLTLHPGCWLPTRQWPPHRFAQAARTLARRYGLLVVVTGGEADRPAAEQVMSELGTRCIDLVGKTSLGALGSLFRRSELVLTNDTGPAHLAKAVGGRTVIIVGSVPWQRYHSPSSERHRLAWVDVPCRPCGLHQCPIGYLCLTGVTVEHVIAQAEELLRSHRSSMSSSS